MDFVGLPGSKAKRMSGGDEDGGDEAPLVQEQGAGDSMPSDSDEARLINDVEIKVEITSSDTKIEMGKDKKEAEAGESFQGLSEEELEQYATDPSWVRLRWALFLLFLESKERLCGFKGAGLAGRVGIDTW